MRRSDERYNEAVDELNLVRATASSAERTLREENYKAFTAMRADYEAKILNLTVAQQSESASGIAEVARLT
eukprot:11210460-Heterocapsa_arctica.AAC.1